MLEDILHAAKELKVFALGKGILSLAVIAAATIGAATGLGVMVPALVIGGGGFALTVANQLYKKALREDEMVDLYRDDIAAQLKIAPDAVTRADLKTVAKDNPIIEQALDRQRKETVMTLSTAAMAGLTSILLIGAFNVGGMVHGMAQASFTGLLKPIAGLIGMGTVSAASSLILHDGVDAAIGYGTGMRKASANDLIVAMNRQIAHGNPVSREEVYAVLVASDRALDRTIVKQTGKSYGAMTHAEQGMLLQHYELAEAMDKLARDISTGAVSPGHLAFMTDEYHPAPKVTEDTICMASPAKASFVERLGLSAAHGEMSHAERLAQKTASAPSASIV